MIETTRLIYPTELVRAKGTNKADIFFIRGHYRQPSRKFAGYTKLTNKPKFKEAIERAIKFGDPIVVSMVIVNKPKPHTGVNHWINPVR